MSDAPGLDDGQHTSSASNYNHIGSPFFVAVHVGAGSHSKNKYQLYRACMARACQAAAEVLRTGGKPLAAIVAAVKVLEDDTCTNAGAGSNLTEEGHVECDASVMDGFGTWGGVACAPGLQNPVEVAAALAEASRKPMLLGRVRPQLLAGDGARRWALQQGLPTAPTREAALSYHITTQSQLSWRRYKVMLLHAEQQHDLQQEHQGADIGAGRLQTSASGEQQVAATGWLQKPEQQQRQEHASDMAHGDDTHPACVRNSKRLRGTVAAVPAATFECLTAGHADLGPCCSEVADTVGCVVVNACGEVAAGVSSGGIALKASGRVGEAALMGCGCWAQNQLQGRPAAAVSASGVGERIMVAGLSRECAVRMVGNATAADDACSDAIRSLLQPQPGPWDCGVLGVKVEAADGMVQVEMCAVHTAPSFGVAYFAIDMARPKTMMLQHAAQPQDTCPEPAAFGTFKSWPLSPKP